MEDVLKRLLQAETEAEAVIEAAQRERERRVDAALAETRANEARFEARLAELRRPYIAEAEARAEQGVAELTRKYGERQRVLRELAARHEAEAVAAAVALLLDMER